MTQYGPLVDVFFLDTRNGYLGRTQTEWLSEKVLNSVAKWKLLIYGLPLCSHSHDIPVEEGNQELKINTNFEVEEQFRGEARVSIQVDEDEEAHNDKYTLLSVLSALTNIYVTSSEEGQQSVPPAAEISDMDLTLKPGVVRIRTGLVVISSGRTKVNSVPTGPYFTTFTPKSSKQDSMGVQDADHFYAEIYAGGEDTNNLVNRRVLFSSEIIHDSVWDHHAEESRPKPYLTFCKIFVNHDDMLEIEIWSTALIPSISDSQRLRGDSDLSSPLLLFRGLLDTVGPPSN